MAISWGRFDTRTIVLIPIAMAINIVLGQTVASVLKVPIYMDSIGTILVGVLAGPIPGLVTGILTNLVWTYVIPSPFHSDFAAPFAVVAAWIGLFSGLAAQWGFFRSRPNASWGKIAGAALLVILVLGGIGYYGFLPFYTVGSFTFFGDTSGAAPVFVLFGYLIALGIIAAIVGLIVLLVVRRDIGVAYVAIAGLICGIVSAIISAPIAAGVFGGVTGAGTDLLVSAYRALGLGVFQSVFAQGLTSDPLDKTISYTIVFFILGALPITVRTMFSRGEAAVSA